MIFEIDVSRLLKCVLINYLQHYHKNLHNCVVVVVVVVDVDEHSLSYVFNYLFGCVT